MKISPLSSICFTSTPIYNIKLKKQNSDGTISEVPATFSKLSRFDKEDIETIEKLSRSWKGTRYGEKITSAFLDYESDLNDEDEFYTIEGRDSLGEKMVYSLSEIDPTRRFLVYIQTAPNNKRNGIKGSGEVMLWGIGKKLGQNSFGHYYTLFPSYNAMEFYRQAGFSYHDEAFSLDKECAPQFFKRIEEKYKFET